MEELSKAREIIDNTDREMAALFVRRMEAVRTIAAYKKERGLPIEVPEREQAVIEKNSAFVEDPLVRAHYVQFLQNTMQVSRDFQHKLIEGERIAYSGVEGAFANIAAKKIFPDGNMISCAGFRETYEAVLTGGCDHAVLPIENSYAGEVGQVMDLMFKGPLYVNSVYTLRIRQHLLGLPGTSASDIRKVISHPQALSQCRHYIRAHGFASEEASNTAVAAQRIAASGDRTIAAIASHETAELYGLSVLDHDINESGQNATRFAVFSRVRNAETSGSPHNNHFILLFTVRNEAGALARAIDIIGRYGFNMSALRSRPMGALAWQYYFYVEASGDLNTTEGKTMLGDLAGNCDMLKIAGCFPGEQEL